jgi:N-acetylglucosaminyldiphosphoundecaprenol N-acetyl-beta-D-mannosaminyltransferase
VRTITFGSLHADCVTQAEALVAFEQLVQKREGGAVFTPNVDHVVLAEDHPHLRAAYSRVNLSLADGMPLLWAARLVGERLPERVSGSDFVPTVLSRAAELGWRVYFLGGAPGVAATARDKLCEKLPRLRIVGVDAPTIDVNDPPERREPIVARIRAACPDVVIVALGAPKQEIWIDIVRDGLRPAVFLGAGATLDFLSGAVPRAPRWISNAGLEWLFRLSKEPRRLWRRYLLRDPRFIVIVGGMIVNRGRLAIARRLRRRKTEPITHKEKSSGKPEPETHDPDDPSTRSDEKLDRSKHRWAREDLKID